LATRSPLLDIDTVDVQGAVHIAPAAIREAAQLQKTKAMVDVDAAAAARRVEALPWIEGAQVVKKWPGRVSITVTEREPLGAAVDPEGRWWLLDRTGRVLDEVTARPPLVALEGVGTLPAPGNVVENAGPALTVGAALSPDLRARVDAVVVVQGGGVDLRLKDREGSSGSSPTVQLGDLEHLDQKLRAAESVLAQVDLRGLSTLDVRLPASPVLTRLEQRATVSTRSAG
jgi:cell division protein FtsQ